MAQRLVRAKRKIRNAGIPYRVPPAHLLPNAPPASSAWSTCSSTEGTPPAAGADLVRANLCAEAVRLARVLARLMPDEPEVLGLLALLLLHDARRATPGGRGRRAGDAGGPGVRLDGRRRRGRRPPGERPAPRTPGAPPDPGRHRRLSHHRRDGRGHGLGDIAALYGELTRFVPSAVVRLDHAVAVGMSEGPEAGLALVAELERRASCDSSTCCPPARRRSPLEPVEAAGRTPGRWSW